MIAGAPTRANIPASLAVPSAASSNFWTYETIKRDSQISQDDDFDFSAKMTHEMEKVTRKALADRVTSVGKWLSLLAAAAVIAVLNIRKVTSLWKWLRGIIYRGKHKRSGVAKNGFWSDIFTAETSPPRHYEGSHSRSCATDAFGCGSPGDHHKEYWPKGQSLSQMSAPA